MNSTLHRKTQIECGAMLFNPWPLTILRENVRCHLLSRLFVQKKRFQPQPFLYPQESQLQMTHLADARPLAHTTPSRAVAENVQFARSFCFCQVSLALQSSCCRTASRIKFRLRRTQCDRCLCDGITTHVCKPYRITPPLVDRRTNSVVGAQSPSPSTRIPVGNSCKG